MWRALLLFVAFEMIPSVAVASAQYHIDSEGLKNFQDHVDKALKELGAPPVDRSVRERSTTERSDVRTFRVPRAPSPSLGSPSLERLRNEAGRCQSATRSVHEKAARRNPFNLSVVFSREWVREAVTKPWLFLGPRLQQGSPADWDPGVQEHRRERYDRETEKLEEFRDLFLGGSGRHLHSHEEPAYPTGAPARETVTRLPPRVFDCQATSPPDPSRHASPRRRIE